MQKVGGQAIIEGVMIRSADRMAIAVRDPKGKIRIKFQKLNLLSEKMKKWIFIRGIINLVEMLSHGIKALNYSSDIALGEEKKEEKNNWFLFTIMLIISLSLGLLIFKFLPLLVAQLINPNSNIIFNIINGVSKLILFVAYVYAISLMKDIKTVFKYHGAEHKVINCYEAKKELTIKNAKRYTTLNPRCGTSFIMIVILISIIVYIFIIPRTTPMLYKFIYQVLLLPVIAGISYEILKLGAKYEKNFFFHLFDKPGLWIQKITTKEPNEKQLEVALAALKKVL